MIPAKDNMLITNILLRLVNQNVSFIMERATIHLEDELEDAYSIIITRCVDVEKVLGELRGNLTLTMGDRGLELWAK